MATIELVIPTIRPGQGGDFTVGSLEWHLGDGNLTKIRAKLSSGAATFNAKITSPGESLNGWDYDEIPNGIIEDLGQLMWQVRSDDLGRTGYTDTELVTNWYSYSKILTTMVASGSERPEYRNAGSTLGPNSDTDTVYFDGTANVVKTTPSFSSLPPADDWTLFVVLGDLGTTNPAPLVGTYDTSATAYETLYGRSSRMIIRDDDLNTKQTSTNVPDTDQIRCITFDESFGTYGGVSEYVNGLIAYEDGTGPRNTASFTFNAIGAIAYDSADEFLDAGVSEVLLWNGLLTTDQRQAIEGYLSHRWNIALSLGHPYQTINPIIESYIDDLTSINVPTTYMELFSGTHGIENGQMISFYTPNAQNPGTLTVELTYTVS